MSQTVLAMDASTEALTLALSHHGQEHVFFKECPQQHSQMILPEIDKLLSAAKIALSDVDLIVFGQGPGSFTGVRIGVAMAQGLAFTHDIPLVGVSTLQTMAQQAVAQGHHDVLVAIDARMGEIYCARYQAKDGIATLQGDERVCAPEQHGEKDFSGVCVGTGWQTYPEHVPENANVLTDIRLPNAAHMLATGQDKAVNQGTVTAMDAQPVYVRDTVTWKKLPGRE